MIDTKDMLILQQLQLDSTPSVKEIAEKIGLTFTPTYERIKQLERAGVIERYVAILNREKLGLKLVVYCNIRLKEQSMNSLKTFEENIAKFDEIQEIMSLSGEYDYMIKIVTKDIDSYSQFVIQKLSNVPNIGLYHSSIVMQVVKNSTAYKLDIREDHDKNKVI